MSGRILAIDFGLKRMGLAISDALGITAQGLPTLERTRVDDDLRHIRGLVEEHSIARVIVGNPVGHAGNETSMSRAVAAFVEKLGRRLPCPVDLWDERLTTAEAMRMLRASGIGMEKRRKARDRVSAVLLLQSFLDYQANERDRAAAGRTEQG
jgi:putative Holliday junction resolvase